MLLLSLASGAALLFVTLMTSATVPGQGNNSQTLETGHADDITSQNPISRPGFLNPTLQGHPATNTGVRTSSMAKTNTTTNWTSEQKVNRTPHIGKRKEGVDFEGISRGVLLNSAADFINGSGGGRVQITRMMNDATGRKLDRNTNILLASVSSDDKLETFDKGASVDSRDRKKADPGRPRKKISVRDVASLLKGHGGNSSVGKLLPIAGVSDDETVESARMALVGISKNENSTARSMLSISSSESNTTKSILGISSNESNTTKSILGISSHENGTAKFISGISSNESSAPIFMSGFFNNDSIVPAFMSQAVSPDSETKSGEMTLDNPDTRGELNKETEDTEDNFVVSIELGDVTFTICSEFMMCQDRCGFVSNDETDGQDSETRKILNTALGHYKSLRNFSRNELPVSDIQKKHQRNFTVRNETIIPEDSKLEFSTLTETKQMSKKLILDAYDVQCVNVSQNYTCSCDDVCVVYGDCCVDVFQSCFLKTKTDDIVEIVSGIKNQSHFTPPSENLTQILAENPEKTMFILSSYEYKFASCESTDWDTNLYLISSCPSGFADASVITKCQNVEASLLPPVTAQFTNGQISFKNAYCARCHGVNLDSLQPWSVSLHCDMTSTAITDLLTVASFSDLTTSKECNVTFVRPTGTCQPRLCEPVSILSSEEKAQMALNVQLGKCSSDDAVLCDTYYIPGNSRRNPSCERCLQTSDYPPNKLEVINLCNQTNPYDNQPDHPTPRDGSSKPTGGILIILDITGVYSRGKHETSTFVCADDEVFDPFFFQCKKLICLTGFQAFRGQCMDTSTSVFIPESSQIFPQGWSRLHILTTILETTAYISCSQIFENSEVGVPHEHFVVDKVFINDHTSINGTVPENISTSFFHCEEYLAQQASNAVQSVDCVLSVTHDVSLDTVHELENVAESLIPLRSDHYDFQISISNMHNAENVNVCTQGQVLAKRSDFSLREHNDNLYAVFNHTQQGVYYPLGNIGYELTIDVTQQTDHGWTITSTVYICQEPELLFRKNCSVVVYFVNETKQEGRGLIINASNEYYKEEDYFITGNNVYVCSRLEFNVSTGKGDKSLTFIILSCSLTGLSVTCLLLMLVVYCVFPELRSLPGKMSASLAGTMMLTFLANLFTLTSLQNDYICPVLAAVTHVVTLAHFGWMAAISVNMALTFGPGIQFLPTRDRDKKVYLRYSAVVWGLSLAIVLTSVIIDFTHRENNTSTNLTTSKQSDESSVSAPDYPRYGQPFCTWFSGPFWARLVFVIIPYFVTFLIISTGFLLTLVGIHQSNKSSEKVGHKSSDKSLCLIYLKLSTAMGFAWIVSIVLSVYPESTVLSYIYVFLVLLQGVLLFLAFTANRRVYTLIISRYFSKHGRDSKHNSQISTITTKSL